MGRLGSGPSGDSAAAGGCHRRAGGSSLCGSLWRWRAWAWESLSDFLGAQRTGRRRVSPAGQMRVEVSVRALCGAGWNQGELAQRQLGLLTLTALISARNNHRRIIRAPSALLSPYKICTFVSNNKLLECYEEYLGIVLYTSN